MWSDWNEDRKSIPKRSSHSRRTTDHPISAKLDSTIKNKLAGSTTSVKKTRVQQG
jgi:hypothetical protein